MQYTYRYEQVDPGEITAADLAEAIAQHGASNAQAYLVTIWDGDRQHPEGGQLVIFSDTARFGFAWNADADWGDVMRDHLLLDERDQHGDDITMPLPE